MASNPSLRTSAGYPSRLLAPRAAGPLALPPPRTESIVRVSATILTKNSARRLAEALNALAWCDEVIVLDTGSTDNTLVIPRGFVNTQVHVLASPFPGFGRAHQQAVALARNDWILSIDSDEVVTEALRSELMHLRPDARTVYAIPFHNHLNGRLIKSCGWYPERHERFFNRRATNFCSGEVHERVQTRGLATRTLASPVRHYPYESADDFLRKMRAYSRLFADQHAGRKAASPGKAVRRSAWAFFKSYVLQRGFMQGYDGFVISAYKAQTTFWKYLLLHDANRQPAA